MPNASLHHCRPGLHLFKASAFDFRFSQQLVNIVVH